MLRANDIFIILITKSVKSKIKDNILWMINFTFFSLSIYVLLHRLTFVSFTGCPKNFFTYFLERLDHIFQKVFLNSKISCISTSFKKEINNLSHKAKKLEAWQFL
jgi:hypothetical protein